MPAKWSFLFHLFNMCSRCLCWFQLSPTQWPICLMSLSGSLWMFSILLRSLFSHGSMTSRSLRLWSISRTSNSKGIKLAPYYFDSDMIWMGRMASFHQVRNMSCMVWRKLVFGALRLVCACVLCLSISCFIVLIESVIMLYCYCFERRHRARTVACIVCWYIFPCSFIVLSIYLYDPRNAILSSPPR